MPTGSAGRTFLTLHAGPRVEFEVASGRKGDAARNDQLI